MEWPVELSGVLVLRAGRVLIGLNRSHSPVRRHFSFWHEVGHYLLHRGSWQVCQAGDGRPKENGAVSPEREADAFATSLLMPDDWVRACSAEMRELSALARRFGVSPRAMARRLQELGLK